MQRLFILLDLLLNRLPILRKLNGHKTAIAGVLAAIAEFIRQVGPQLPIQYQATAAIAEQFIRELSGYVGMWGLSGKGVKAITK